MLQRALLTAVTTILIALMVAFGPKILGHVINEATAGSASGMTVNTDDATTVNLNLGSAADNDFLRDFCDTLEGNQQVVKITC